MSTHGHAHMSAVALAPEIVTGLHIDWAHVVSDLVPDEGALQARGTSFQ